MLGPIIVVFIGVSGLSADDDYDNATETGVSFLMLILYLLDCLSMQRSTPASAIMIRRSDLRAGVLAFSAR